MGRYALFYYLPITLNLPLTSFLNTLYDVIKALKIGRSSLAAAWKKIKEEEKGARNICDK